MRRKRYRGWLLRTEVNVRGEVPRARCRQVDFRKRSRKPTRWCTLAVRTGRGDVNLANSVVADSRGDAGKEVLVRIRDRDLQGLVRTGGGVGEVEDRNRVEGDVQNDERPLDERVDRVGLFVRVSSVPVCDSRKGQSGTTRCSPPATRCCLCWR
jgi:hypothetical protein